MKHMTQTPLLSIVYTAAAISLLFSAVFDVHTVSGDSMEPAFADNETVFIFRWAYGLQPPLLHLYIIRWGKIREGDVLVFREPSHHLRVLKRCTKVVDEGEDEGERVYIRGDNAAVSRDSRHYGYVERSTVEGKVILPP